MYAVNIPASDKKNASLTGKLRIINLKLEYIFRADFRLPSCLCDAYLAFPGFPNKMPFHHSTVQQTWLAVAER